MKKLMVFVGLMVLAGAVQAGEHPDNPDRFPSIGVFLDGAATSGEAEAKASGFTASQDVESTAGGLTLDLRLPISGRTTLYGAIGFISQTSELSETNLLAGGESDESGVAFRLGARWYLK